MSSYKPIDNVTISEIVAAFEQPGGGIQIDLQQQWIGDFTELGKIEDWRPAMKSQP